MESVQTVRGVPRPVTDEQLSRILTEAPEPIRTWCLLAAYQGLRCVEISRLDREHITDENLFVVRGKGDPPGCTTRTRQSGPPSGICRAGRSRRATTACG